MEFDIPKLDSWKEQRKQCIEEIRALGNQLDDYRKASTKASVAGSTVAIAGVAVAIGVAAAPVSGGTSFLAATGVATAVNAVGQGTNFVAGIVEKLKTSNVMKKIDKLIEDDRHRTLEIQAMVKTFEDAEVSVLKHLEECLEGNLDVDTSGPPQLHGNAPVCNRQDVSKCSSSKKELLLSKGILALKAINDSQIRQLVKIGSKACPVVTPLVKKNLQKAGQEAANGLKGIIPQCSKIGRFAKFGGLAVNVALLPVDIYQLTKSAISLKKKEGHESSNEVRHLAEEMEKEIKVVERHLYEAIMEFTNFVKLIRIIKQKGCDEHLDSILNQILRILLPAKHILPILKKVANLPRKGQDHDDIDKTFTCTLINCEDTCTSLLTYLSLIIWSAWKVGQKSVVCLQNITNDPALWALFGVYIQSTGSEPGRGVCTLLSTRFAGDVSSHEEFMAKADDSIDWKGRCLLTNMELEGRMYCIVNMTCPEEITNRVLFMKEVATFIKKNAKGKLVIAANCQLEERMMTVDAKKVVNRKTSLSTLRKFIPFKEVAEYLTYKPRHRDAADNLLWKIMEHCNHYDINIDKLLAVQWNKCKGDMSFVPRDSQLQPIIDLGTTDVWCKKNSGAIEFARSDHHRETKIVTLSQRVDFFVTRELMGHIVKCDLDHDLRFLGFLKQAPLGLQMNV